MIAMKQMKTMMIFHGTLKAVEIKNIYVPLSKMGVATSKGVVIWQKLSGLK